ncbi:hypothetical protein HZY97_06785 [Sphingomonas sp. R-74633]|uniref:hypothetical protein n=1 Tax=Sphingomonas sp. R-74633 TaxID=2751188 RepID=UPI0015D2FB6B|nr:hypothetical protein [Sphingomonas sp. R-74633]NYT40455.1 hypothetical protein [Sphingomonas sp. R-74633]
MRAIKLILSLLPLLYIGGMLYYFTGFKGWSDGPLAGGLGPTVIGLAVVGMILCVPIVAWLIRSLVAPRGPVVVKNGKIVEIADAPAFDADAALARYLERKAAGQGVEIPPDPDAPRPVFGRKLT